MNSRTLEDVERDIFILNMKDYWTNDDRIEHGKLLMEKQELLSQRGDSNE